MLTLVAAMVAVQSQTVSFNCRAEPMITLAQDLGKAIGRRLTVATECENDVLLIAAQSVDADKLLQEIAKVDAAEWVQKGDGLELQPDRPSRNRQRIELEARRAKGMREAIEAYLHKDPAELKKEVAEELKGEGSEDPAESEVELHTKVHYQLVSLLTGIDLGPVSSHPDSVVVFSTRPNSTQLPLGPDAPDTIQAILDAQNAYDADPAVRSQAVAGGDPPPASITGYFKADLSVAFEGLAHVPGVTLRVYDRSGNVVMQHEFDQFVAEITADVLHNRSAPKAPGAPIERDAATQAYLDASNELTLQGLTDEPFPPLLVPFLMDSLRHDPLALLPSDPLIAVANAKGKPLVALVPDSLSDFLDETEQDVERSLQDADSDLSLTVDGGWIEISPSDRAAASEDRIDRRAFADLLAVAQKKGVPNLDDLADFASKVPRHDGGMAWSFMRETIPEMRMLGEPMINRIAARTWAALDPARRQALQNGGVIPLAALPEDLLGDLAQLLYSGDLDLKRAGTKNSDFGVDATEALPRGIPRDAFITVTAQSEPCVCASLFRPSDVEIGIVLTPRKLADMLWRHEIGIDELDPAALKSLQALRVGVRTTYDFAFHFGPDWECDARLQDDRFTVSGQRATLSTLPADFQAAVQADLEARRKRYKKVREDSPNSGGGSPPPR